MIHVLGPDKSYWSHSCQDVKEKLLKYDNLRKILLYIQCKKIKNNSKLKYYFYKIKFYIK